MLRVILADDEQYERNYLEKVIKESYPGLLEIVYKAVDLSLIHISSYNEKNDKGGKCRCGVQNVQARWK